MWILVWMQLSSVVSHFEIGQYTSEIECLDHKKKASVLVTKNNEYLHCFRIKIEG